MIVKKFYFCNIIKYRSEKLRSRSRDKLRRAGPEAFETERLC